jgi:hypothetical protein
MKMRDEPLLPATQDYNPFDYAYLSALYHHRPCAICGHFSWCRHREPQVDLAALAAKKGNHDAG